MNAESVRSQPPCILFVDSEQASLDRLALLLASYKDVWELLFVTTSSAARSYLEERHIDVLVTDMALPDQDGLSLLTEAHKRYPQTLRIALSSHSDDELTLESLHATHRFVAKPLQGASLEGAIVDSLTLRDALQNEALVKAVSGMDSIPALPEIYGELMREMASSDGTVARMGHIIERDMGLSATLLKIVNSAFYGLFRHVESPAQAATLLGADVVKNMAMSEKLFSQFEHDDVNLERLGELNLIANVTGVLATRFARIARLSRRAADHCQIAGLLGRLGDLVIESRLRDNPAVLDGTLRPEMVAGHILELWALPGPVVEGVTFQHNPPGSVCTNPEPAHILYAIRYLQRHMPAGMLPQPSCIDQCQTELEKLYGAELAGAWIQVYLEWLAQDLALAA